MLIPDAERLAPDAWIARIGEFPLAYEPGTRWLYHTASDILGILLTCVTGKPLKVALRERIFEPLVMMDTSFVVQPEKRSRLSVLYGPAPEGGLLCGIILRPRSELSRRSSRLEVGASFLRLTITNGSGECC